MSENRTRSKFDLDLAAGEARESALVKALQRCCLEHKQDVAHRRTGNLAFEIRQGDGRVGKGRPSGIAVTEADWWGVEFGPDAWLVMRTSRLKDFVRLYARDQRARLICGDNQNENVLVPMQELIHHLSADALDEDAA